MVDLAGLAKSSLVEPVIEFLGDLDSRAFDPERHRESIRGTRLVTLGFILLGDATPLASFFGEGFKMFLCHGVRVYDWIIVVNQKKRIF